MDHVSRDDSCLATRQYGHEQFHLPEGHQLLGLPLQLRIPAENHLRLRCSSHVSIRRDLARQRNERFQRILSIGCTHAWHQGAVLPTSSASQGHDVSEVQNYDSHRLPIRRGHRKGARKTGDAGTETEKRVLGINPNL